MPRDNDSLLMRRWAKTLGHDVLKARYCSTINLLIVHKRKHLADMRAADLRHFLRGTKDAELVAAVKSMFRFLHAAGVRRTDIAADLEVPEAPPVSSRPPRWDDLAAWEAWQGSRTGTIPILRPDHPLRDGDLHSAIRAGRIRMVAELHGSFTEVDIDRIYKAQRGRCGYCRAKLARKDVHRDHIVALARGGTNQARNIQILCKPCNVAKGAKDPIDYAHQMGLLI